MKQLFHEGTVRIGPAAGVPDVLRSLGVDPVDVLDEAGLGLEVFENPDNLISFSARSRLLALCQARTACEHFGLLVGKPVGLSSLGLVGYLVLNSADVESALHSLVHYFYFLAQGSIVIQMVERGAVFLGYSMFQSKDEGTIPLEDAAVAIMFNTLGTLCGPDWKPIEICFAHHRPEDLKPYQEFFQAPLRFNAEFNRIYFDAKYLKQTIKSADPELHRLLKKQIDQLDAKYGDDFLEQVRRVLSTALLTGRAKADQVAEVFSMHSRTMNRRLGTYGTSFGKLADEVRYGIARQMLNDTDLEVKEIADLIGYADASAFTKAFKRWSSMTPTHWRIKQNR